MTASGGRFAGAAVLLAAAVAGLAWASVFTLPPLLAPVLAALLPALLADWLALRAPRLAAVRPVLALLGGAALGLAALLLTGPATLPDVLDGVVHGYRHTLDSTLPARPDPTLLSFVPALALLAGVVGVEWCRRGAAPVLALVPSLAVLVFGQAVHTAQGWAAPATAAAYGLAGAGVLAAGHSAARGALRRGMAVLPLLLPLVVVAGVAAWAGVAATDATGRTAYSVQAGHTVETRMAATADPLEEIGDRLAHPDTVAFTVRSSVPVDRWPLVVLDRFDGVNWQSDADYRILGSALPDPPLTVPVDPADADVSDVALDGPWLPTQGHLRAVDGARTWVDPDTGVLLREPDAVVSTYHLSWNDVQVDREHLTAAAIDPAPVGAVELAQIPTGFAELARQAVGQGVGPSVSAALLLEKWMRTNLRVATGADIPTGHSEAQLLHFLTGSKVGTSEQFATSYAVLARSLGIPTRVVVGFRDPGTGTIHDGDVLAWPEVAVAGLGWVPLDPTGGARTAGAQRGGLAAATQQARDELPSPSQLAAQDAAAAPPPPPPASDTALPPWWVWVVLVLVLLAAVPAARAVRRFVRRRRAPRESVLGAWSDVRDALTDQGVRLPPGATVRDVLALRPGEAADVAALADCVDRVCWSGAPPDRAAADAAWRAAGAVRRALGRGSWRARLRALWGTAALRRPRGQAAAQIAPRSGSTLLS